ncbi:hypothetical protein ANCCAN_22627 [Ancylostoma caninum]|uniref:TauD/TfdA-like domain-containing protein n=1 Tax=Ancylostoma caninum TaxID=29170 RepID=A0A368FHE9_ANCCA|nr:hypothetical protein ANCCAN_22627 [Ancylostoma caninum]
MLRNTYFFPRGATRIFDGYYNWNHITLGIFSRTAILHRVFHCLHPAVEGGDTLLVDGFNCVRQLKEQNPEAFEILSKRKIEHHYVEFGDSSGGLFSTSREKSVIELDSHGNVVQIRLRTGNALNRLLAVTFAAHYVHVKFRCR